MDLKCYRCGEWPCVCRDGITLIHGDCREVIGDVFRTRPFDLILTDPPYGIAHKSNGQIFKDAQPIAGDGDSSLLEFIDQWALSRCALAAFYSPFNPPNIKWRTVLIWNKGKHVGAGGDPSTCWKRDAELIGVKGNWPLLGGRDSCVLNFNAESPPKSGHFCEKPLSLMKYLVAKFSEPSLCDPFCGSGTTLEAAKAVGKRAIGIELEEKWVDYTANRLRQEVLQFSE